MIKAAFGVMALRLKRDVPSLLLVFALPPLVFLVFTLVFREASTRVPEVSVELFDASGTGAGGRTAAALEGGGGLRLRQAGSEAELRSRVAGGGADIGVVTRGSADPGGSRPEVVAVRPRTAAAAIVTARLAGAAAPAGMAQPGAPPVVVIAALHGDPVVIEEIGAVAAMFLMIAAIQVAATLVDERRSGIHERTACSGDVSGLVLGKFAFGIGVGVLQAGLIVATAGVAFNVAVLPHPFRLLMASILTAAMATSLTLLIAACCSTRHQAQTIATFAILVSSAIGGSMVPSRLMPESLSRLGSLMPNAWSIRAFADAFDLERAGHPTPIEAWLGLLSVSLVAAWLAVVAFRRPAAL